jgi:hypothetical protein
VRLHLATARINGTWRRAGLRQIADDMEMPRNLDLWRDLTSAADIETPDKVLAVAFERNLDLRSIHVQDADGTGKYLAAHANDQRRPV